MKLFEKAIMENKILNLNEIWIKKFWCPAENGYNDIIKCKEGKFDCHDKTCWDIEIRD